jgi:mannose/fructose/N-acetylgalactosamine-specific phosphotransferase system component IIC
LVEALIFGAVVFVVGSFFVLERHCLGQMAIIQPLTVCLAVGWFSGNEEMGLWLGISMQFFSTASGRRIDWALAGVVAAGVLTVAQRLGIELSPGSSGAYVVALGAVMSGMAARRLETWFARVDGARIRSDAFWQATDVSGAVESLVHRSVRRWLLIGGTQVVIGIVLIVAVLYGLMPISGRGTGDDSIWAMAMPMLGGAVAVSSLASNKCLVWMGVSMVVAGALII